MISKPVVEWDLSHWKNFTQNISFLSQHELEKISKAGEGNMNLALRLTFKQQSLIAKHSPSYCFKYPEISAPIERLKGELEFFKLASQTKNIKTLMPEILHYDEIHNIALMEDLGECQDYSYLYDGWKKDFLPSMTSLTAFLSSLHKIDLKETSFQNTSMRNLNHEYIFNLPFLDKSFDLLPIFDKCSKEALLVRDDLDLQKKMLALGKLYLNEGQSLVHGDFYPRSWLDTARGPVVIDPEFCFKGLAEFDLGVFVAHLKLSQTPPEDIKDILNSYEAPTGFNANLMQQFAGAEILRRLLYFTQVPVTMPSAVKLDLLTEAAETVKANF